MFFENACKTKSSTSDDADFSLCYDPIMTIASLNRRATQVFKLAVTVENPRQSFMLKSEVLSKQYFTNFSHHFHTDLCGCLQLATQQIMA